MTTRTVMLEPWDIAASVRSLKAEFVKAKLSDVKTVMRRGAVHVEIPIARLSDYRFSYGRERCSWKTPGKKVVIGLKGFVVEHQAHNKSFHVVFRLPPSRSEPSVPGRISPIRKVFRERSLRAVEELQALDEKRLAEAVQEPTDYSVLLSALNTEEALASIRTHDPLAGARLRGLDAKRKLVEAAGGTLSSSEVAKALQITRQAVDKRRKEGTILAVELGKKGFRYPAWQIGLPHLAKVLGTLGGRDSWERLSFFLNPSALLDGRTPLDVLQDGRHEIADVLRAASVYGEQGG